MQWTGRTIVVAAAACVLLALPSSLAHAAGEKPAAPSAAEVRTALASFKKLSRSKLAGERIEAVRALASAPDKRVAKALLKFIRKEKEPEVLRVAFETLGSYKSLAQHVVPKLAARIAQEAAAEHKRMARGDAGIHVDARTGEADTRSVKGRTRVLAMEERSRMLAALMGALNALDWDPGKSPPDLTPLLQDPSDELVAAVLAWMARHRIWSALPAALELYRMYPSEASWETGGVTDLGGTDASAKAKWMVIFGHPDKQRARPQVFEALMAMIQALTSQTFETPDSLDTFLKTKDAKLRVKRGRSRR